MRSLGKGFRGGGFGGGGFIVFVKFLQSVFCLLLESFPPRKSCAMVGLFAGGGHCLGAWGGGGGGGGGGGRRGEGGGGGVRGDCGGHLVPPRPEGKQGGLESRQFVELNVGLLEDCIGMIYDRL